MRTRVPFCPFFVSDADNRPAGANTYKGGYSLEVRVIDNDVEKALKILKNKLSKNGFFKELKLRMAYEKPSVKRKKKSEAARKRKFK